MKSNERKTMNQLYSEMYISEEHKRVERVRDVNQEILDLLKSQGISDEEIHNFVDFVRHQSINPEGDYESHDRFHEHPHPPKMIP